MELYNTATTQNTNKFVYRLNVFLFYLIIIMLGILLIRTATLNKDFMNSIALATSIQPEKFTELYFENHLKLPSTIKPNQTITFSFTVHNVEYQTYTYPYDVYIYENGKKIEIDKGAFTLPSNGYKTISESYTVTNPFQKARLIVELTNNKQQIFFWITTREELQQ